MQLIRSIYSAVRVAALVSVMLALSACGGDNAAPTAAPQPAKLALGLLPGLEATATTGAKSLTPKATLPSFTGHGWWWNPAEPGTGFAFEVQGTQAFVAFFMYDQSSGAPVWYASFGTFSGNTFTGNLQSFKNGMPIAATAFKPAALDATQGLVTIVFSSATNGRVTFPGGRVQNVERYNFISPAAGEAAPVRTNKPEAGWWWNQDEPGRGYAIERQGNDIFLAAFHYTTAGASTWNIINTKLIGGTNLYGATIKSVKDGQSLTGAWRTASFGLDAGTADLIFNTPCEATVRLPAGNLINLRKYNFGGDEARCRADIAASLAQNLPELAQCHSINPGTRVATRQIPTISSATANNGTPISYYRTETDNLTFTASFQNRPIFKTQITSTNLDLPLSATNPASGIFRLFEITPTAYLNITPNATLMNGISVFTNTSRSGARDMTLAVGETQYYSASFSTSARSTELMSQIYNREFAGLETLTVAGKQLFNVCKINYQVLVGVSFNGSLSDSSTQYWTGSAWYAPGYGYVKESFTANFRDGRSPNRVTFETTAIAISP